VKIELSHDILAKNIFDKASAEDKTRLKILNFIKGRYADYEASKNKVLLKKGDLDYIGPYTSQLAKENRLDEKELGFIKKSKQHTKLSAIWGIASTAVLVLSLTITVFLVDQNRRHAEVLKDKAMNETIKVEKEKNAKEVILAEYVEEKKQRIKAVEAFNGQDEALKGSREQLARAYEDLKIAEQRLEKANAGLNKKNTDLVVERSTLKKDIANLGLERKKLEQEKVKLFNDIESKKAELSRSQGEKTKSDSRILSSKALYMLHQNNNNADAFKLATEAFRMDDTNKEARAVLDELMTGRQDYFERTGGPSLKTEDIIKKLMPNYGTINTDSKDKIIKGQWPAALKKMK